MRKHLAASTDHVEYFQFYLQGAILSLIIVFMSQSMLWCPLRFSNVWFVFFSVVCFVCLCIGFNGTFNNISVIS